MTTSVLQCLCGLLGQEPSHPNDHAVWDIAGDCGLPGGCRGPAAHPSSASATSVSLGSVVRQGLQMQMFWGMQKCDDGKRVSAVRVCPLYGGVWASELS